VKLRKKKKKKKNEERRNQQTHRLMIFINDTPETKKEK